MTVEIPLDRHVLAPLGALAGLLVAYLLARTSGRWGPYWTRFWSSPRVWTTLGVAYLLGYVYFLSWWPEFQEYIGPPEVDDGPARERGVRASVVEFPTFVGGLVAVVDAVLPTAYWSEE